MSVQAVKSVGRRAVAEFKLCTITLGTVFLLGACEPACEDDSEYHQVDLIGWCEEHAGCTIQPRRCPTCIGMGPGAGFEATFPLGDVRSDVPLTVLEVALDLTEGSSGLTVAISADGVSLCEFRAPEGFSRTQCAFPSGASEVTVESSEQHPGFNLEVLAREAVPTIRSQRCPA